MTSLMTDMIQTDWRLNEITDRSSWSVRRRFNIWPGSSWTPHFGGETQNLQNLLEGLHGPSSLWPPRGGWRSVHVQLQSALCWTLQQINVLFYFYFSMKPFNKNMNLQFVSIKSSAVGSETSSWTFSLWKNFRLQINPNVIYKIINHLREFRHWKYLNVFVYFKQFVTSTLHQLQCLLKTFTFSRVRVCHLFSHTSEPVNVWRRWPLSLLSNEL